jgi:23S rRNA pseudouridine1911/1915/1917 synthase
MAKTAPGDLKAILRQFGVAGSDDSDKHIDQIKVSHPLPINTLIAFRFDKQHYYVLYDETAGDDLAYLSEQIDSEASDISEGRFLENPNESGATYGVPFKGKAVYLYSVDVDKKRLDLMLAENYPDTSRSTWQKHIKAGRVSVNGKVVTSSKEDVSASDEIEVRLPDAPDYSQRDLPIIFIDDNVVVINKPAGILTHSKGAENDEFTVADFFRRYSSVGLDTNRPGIIHRLDRDTSGVLIGARTETTASLLARQFADRKTKKTYIAVVAGTPKQDEAVIDLPIGRNPSAPSTFRVDPKGRSAITRYKVLATNDKESLVELRPVTGRTHQLRVHMAHIGTPIKGDRVYGQAADRLYLHAYRLEITIPQGDRRTFEAPLPPEFTDKFNDVRLP